MRYFRIFADEKNIPPQIQGWYSMIKPNIFEGRKIYEALCRRNHLKVEYSIERQFPDIISRPCFMVSKGLADLIRLYRPGIQFKYIVLFDEKNKRTVTYQIPDLPEIDCLDESSEIARDRITIKNGILCGEKIREEPIFRLKGAEGRHIMANLDFVESAYRREVRGMAIEEFVVI